MSTQTDIPTFSVRSYEMPFEGMTIFDAESFVDATEYEYLVAWEGLSNDWLGGIEIDQVPHLPDELGDRAFYAFEEDLLSEISRETFQLYYVGEYEGDDGDTSNIGPSDSFGDDEFDDSRCASSQSDPSPTGHEDEFEKEWVEIANHEWDTSTLRIIPERYVFDVEARGGYVVTADDVKHSRPNVETYQDYEVDSTHLHDFSTYVWEIRDEDLIHNYLYDPSEEQQYGVGDDANGSAIEDVEMRSVGDSSTLTDEPSFSETSFEDRVGCDDECT